MRNKYHRVVVGLFLTCCILVTMLSLTLGSCATDIPAREGSPTASTLPTRARIPTTIPSATPTTPTPTPTATNTPVPLPPLPDPVLENLLFSPEPIPSCQLPCWHGLVPGKSSRADVQGVFDTVFAFNGRDVFSEPAPKWYYATPPSSLDIVTLIWDHFVYSSQPPSLSGFFFEVSLYTEKSNTTLRAVSFHWSTDTRELKPLTPQKIMQELGPPSNVLIRIEEGQMDSASMELHMIYDQGVVFWIVGGLKTYPVQTKAGVRTSADICLNQSFSSWSAHLVEPFREGLNDLTPVQRYLLKESHLYLPPSPISIQEALNISPSELAALVQQDPSTCLTVDLSVFQQAKL